MLTYIYVDDFSYEILGDGNVRIELTEVRKLKKTKISIHDLLEFAYRSADDRTRYSVDVKILKNKFGRYKVETKRVYNIK